MVESTVRAKRWGNSIGLVIPKSIVNAEGIVEDDFVKIDIKKEGTAREIWGLFPNLKINPQKAKDEMRSGWE